MANKMKMIIEKPRKLVVVGDGMCGKTSLLYTFIYQTFDATHTPTIFDTYATEIQINGKKVTLALFDTAGEEDFDRLRPLSYCDTHIVLICYCVNHPASAANVTEKWIPEIRHFCGQCPIILVACKTDLRSDAEVIEKLKRQNEKPVTTEFGKQLAARVHANAYMECSAKTGEGITELFDLATRLSLEKNSQRKKRVKCALY